MNECKRRNFKGGGDVTSLLLIVFSLPPVRVITTDAHLNELLSTVCSPPDALNIGAQLTCFSLLFIILNHCNWAAIDGSVRCSCCKRHSPTCVGTVAHRGLFSLTRKYGRMNNTALANCKNRAIFAAPIVVCSLIAIPFWPLWAQCKDVGRLWKRNVCIFHKQQAMMPTRQQQCGIFAVANVATVVGYE